MNKKALKKLYLSLLSQIREVARECGYAIGVHGSLTRDMDLIAVPWVERPLDEEDLVLKIVKIIKGRLLITDNMYKPHGRKAYTIVLDEYKSKTEWAVFIDLSVMSQQIWNNSATAK